MSRDELKHYGVLGMKWGVRKYQNKDGSLTEAGRKRYGNQGSFRYTSPTTAVYATYAYSNAQAAKKAEKLGKATKAERRRKLSEKQRELAITSQKLDDAFVEYAKNTSVGKAIVGNLLMGPLGYETYARARTAKESRVKAIVRAYFDVYDMSFMDSMQRELIVDAYNKKNSNA